MEIFEEYLSRIENPVHRERMEQILKWTLEKFPNLSPVIKWNEPMLTDHGTFIIAYGTSKKHISVAPEQAGINQFADDIANSGYDHTKELIRIPWDRPVDFQLLEKIIEFNILDKADCPTFWR